MKPILVFLLVFSSLASAAQPILVADIEPSTSDSYPDPLTILNG